MHAFKAEVERLHKGLELPAHLFSVIKRHFAIEKGALLLLEPAHEAYVPWALCGFDETTNHRLRLPVSVLETWPGIAEGDRYVFQDKIPEVVSPYFSSRELSLIERVLIYPFCYNGTLQAVLLVAASAMLDADPVDIEPALNELSALSGPLLHDSRQSKIGRLPNPEPNRNSDIASMAEQAIRKARENNTGVLFLLIDIASIIKPITEKTPDADQFRVKQDIVTVLTSMVQNTGSIAWAGKNQVVLATGGKIPLDSELLLHQIAFALKHLFPETGNTESFVKSIQRYPEDGNTVQEILEKLL